MRVRLTISTVFLVFLLGCKAQATNVDAGTTKPDAELVLPQIETMKPDAGVRILDAETELYDPTMHPDFVGC